MSAEKKEEGFWIRGHGADFTMQDVNATRAAVLDFYDKLIQAGTQHLTNALDVIEHADLSVIEQALNRQKAIEDMLSIVLNEAIRPLDGMLTTMTSADGVKIQRTPSSFVDETPHIPENYEFVPGIGYALGFVLEIGPIPLPDMGRNN
jgi:hypothetical protein